MKSPYAGYDVLSKWNTPSFNERTRQVLKERLDGVPARSFLSEAEWATLDAIVARLVPQPDRSTPIPITPWIDDDLAHDRGEGFRAPGMPRSREQWRRGLAGIDAEALGRAGRPFRALDPEMQDATLHAIQDGDVDPAHWQGIDARHFFTHVLLKRVAGLYYTHPDEYGETLESTMRIKAYDEPIAASWPESLETWKRYYAEHPRPVNA